MFNDWTADGGRLNSSSKYEELVKEVEQTIRGSAGTLFGNKGAYDTARLIVSRLAHVYHLSPHSEDEPEPLPTVPWGSTIAQAINRKYRAHRYDFPPFAFGLGAEMGKRRV